MRPETGFLVAELALEADDACEAGDDEQSRDTFPERELGAHDDLLSCAR